MNNGTAEFGESVSRSKEKCDHDRGSIGNFRV